MGNQPSRKTTGTKSSGKHPAKMIKAAKKSIKQKNVEQTVKIVVEGGLKPGGKSILATSLFAASRAYLQYQKNPSSDITKISHDSISNVIKSKKSTIPREWRIILKSSISTALSSLVKNEKVVT